MEADDLAPFFLFIGSGDSEGSRSKLKASGIYYRRKMLESSPDNWAKINDLLGRPEVVGVIIKFTSATCGYLVSDRYSPHATRMLELLSKKRHLLFVHRSVLAEPDDVDGGKQEPSFDEQIMYDDLADDEMQMLWDRHYFGPPPEDTRRRVVELIREYRLNLAVYLNNAELSVLAQGFIEASEKNLLFRIYVPVGRAWAAEADKLLSLFREWLSRVKGERVRQDGYSTAQGEVYEFFSDGQLAMGDLSTELREFSDFLELCIENPDMARAILQDNSVPESWVSKIIEKYAKEARRLKIDIRHERETKLLSIRHRLESELLEYDADVDDAFSLANSLVPAMAGFADSLSIASSQSSSSIAQPIPTIVVNQQVFKAVNGIVASELSGVAHLRQEPAQLLELISRFGEQQRADLESSVHELEDEDAKKVDRVSAKQKLLGFLVKVGGQVSGPTISVLQKYLEAKLGI